MNNDKKCFNIDCANIKSKKRIINFTSPKKYRGNKNYGNKKEIIKKNLFEEDNKIQNIKHYKEKTSYKFNDIYINRRNENKYNNFPLNTKPYLGKNRRNFSSKINKIKSSRKESIERIHHNNNSLENDIHKRNIMKHLLKNYIKNDLYYMGYNNESKKSNRIKELGRKSKILSEAGICIDKIYSNYILPKKIKNNIFNYKIAKIEYTLNSKCIQSLKIIYKNRTDYSLITVQNVDCLIESQKKYIINFPDCFEIKLLQIEKEENKDIGFTLQCGNEIYVIGYKKNLKSQNQIFNNQILLGIEMKACPYYGISNLNFKIMDSSKFVIQFYNGFLYLRAKLKKNLAYKKKIFSNINSFYEKQKLIINICNLPDLLFYLIMKDLLII